MYILLSVLNLHETFETNKCKLKLKLNYRSMIVLLVRHYFIVYTLLVMKVDFPLGPKQDKFLCTAMRYSSRHGRTENFLFMLEIGGKCNQLLIIVCISLFLFKLMGAAPPYPSPPPPPPCVQS